MSIHGMYNSYMAEKYTERAIFMMKPSEKVSTERAAKKAGVSFGEFIRQSIRRHMTAFEAVKVRNVAK